MSEKEPPAKDESSADRGQGADQGDRKNDGPQRPHKPWRTEGLPAGHGDDDKPRRPRWWKWTAWIVGGYLVLFLLTTMQDQLSGGEETIAYTDFTVQVQKQNVAEIFSRGDTIQGRLKQAAEVPGKSGSTYTKFTTERPTFANDNLYGDLQKGGATVRATPVVAQRGVLWNLLISLGPFILIAALLLLAVPAEPGAVAVWADCSAGGGQQKKPVDPSTVRVTFADVAGIDEVEAEIERGRRLPEGPGEVPAARARGRRRACCWPARPGPGRRCSRGRPRARPGCRSSPRVPRSSSR